MADIAAGDVTYALKDGARVPKADNAGRKHYVYEITFGDGTDTYPTGGVPLTKGNMGLTEAIEEFYIMDAGSANGFVYKYDYDNEKIRIYQGDNDAESDGALVELAGGSATPAEATLIVKVVGW